MLSARQLCDCKGVLARAPRLNMRCAGDGGAYIAPGTDGLQTEPQPFGPVGSSSETSSSGDECDTERIELESH